MRLGLTMRPPPNPTATGLAAEQAACNFLQQQGLRLLARNVRYRHGELDLVMQDGVELVFVEVRYRRSTRYGTSAETITGLKQRRLLHCAQLYLQQQATLTQPAYRFDVVTLERTLARCVWHKNAMNWDDAWI